jgi:murein DD-endopeptidase MepM/ murein hydrolase activator NlpD
VGSSGYRQRRSTKQRHTSQQKSGPFRSLWRLLTQRFTIMLIPHSERGVLNFHVNALVLIFALGLFGVILGGFIYLSSVHVGTTAIIDDQESNAIESQANLDSVLSEVGNLLSVARSFDEELVDTVNSLGIETGDESAPAAVTRGDLSSFFDIREVDDDQSREVQDLQQLASTLQSAVNPLREIRTVLESQQSFLTDIPNFWPVGSGMGRVTMEFGPNIHPITGQWYLHKGIDIAGAPGLPVVASANGKVVEMGYDPGYGFYVFLRHKYGFRTRYSHMQSILVTEGQDVVQGERIGTLGNTGISTGPHLDFIIMLGTDVVDPAVFLKISNTFTRGGTGTR